MSSADLKKSLGARAEGPKDFPPTYETHVNYQMRKLEEAEPQSPDNVESSHQHHGARKLKKRSIWFYIMIISAILTVLASALLTTVYFVAVHQKQTEQHTAAMITRSEPSISQPPFTMSADAQTATLGPETMTVYVTVAPEPPLQTTTTITIAASAPATTSSPMTTSSLLASLASNTPTSAPMSSSVASSTTTTSLTTSFEAPLTLSTSLIASSEVTVSFSTETIAPSTETSAVVSTTTEAAQDSSTISTKVTAVVPDPYNGRCSGRGMACGKRDVLREAGLRE